MLPYLIRQFLCFKNWQDRIRDIRLQHRRMKAIGSSLNSLILRSRIFLYVIKVLNIRLIYFINFHVRGCLPPPSHNYQLRGCNEDWVSTFFFLFFQLGKVGDKVQLPIDWNHKIQVEFFRGWLYYSLFPVYCWISPTTCCFYSGSLPTMQKAGMYRRGREG